MKNQHNWQPSKFEFRGGKFRASDNTNEVGPASRLAADLDAELFYKHIPHHSQGNLLDLGCGKVPLYELYKEKVNSIYCVDWINTAHKNQHIDQWMNLNEKLPLGDESFDTVILTDVLEHILNPRELIREIHRILLPKGKVIINIPFYYWIHEEPHDYYRYTEYALKEFARESKFEILVLERHGGALEIMADITGKVIQRVPLVGLPLCKLVQIISFFTHSTSLGKLVSNKTEEKFPLGYFLILQK